jgi:ankyrin repeat protein
MSSLGTLQAQEISVFDIARNGTLEQFKKAIEKDSNIINLQSKEGYTPLTLACYYSNNEVAKYLIKNVKDINSKSGFGTPLMAAAVKNNKELVALLLKNKANPDAIDKNGSTALHFSVIFNFEEIIKLLIASKANTTIKDNRGNTALDYATITGNKKLTQLIKTQ